MMQGVYFAIQVVRKVKKSMCETFALLVYNLCKRNVQNKLAICCPNVKGISNLFISPTPLGSQKRPTTTLFILHLCLLIDCPWMAREIQEYMVLSQIEFFFFSFEFIL